MFICHLDHVAGEQLLLQTSSHETGWWERSEYFTLSLIWLTWHSAWECARCWVVCHHCTLSIPSYPGLWCHRPLTSRDHAVSSLLHCSLHSGNLSLCPLCQQCSVTLYPEADPWFWKQCWTVQHFYHQRTLTLQQRMPETATEQSGGMQRFQMFQRWCRFEFGSEPLLTEIIILNL